MNYYIELSDKRNISLFALMKESGYAVFAYNALNIAQGEMGDERRNTYIFSPAKKFALDEISNLPNGINLFAGSITDEGKELLRSKSISYTNFMNDTDFALKNATLTAEGVLCLVIEKTKKSIFETKIVILGNGKCGHAIAELFDKLGLDFRVGCRKERAGNINFQSFDLKYLSEHLQNTDLIINTIPVKIIEDEDAQKINKKTVFIEVASIPCLDRAKVGFEYILAGGLPQLYACESAARLMLESII